jgi:hypothetical protein
LGWFWPRPQILRPDWKGFPRANPLAYWASSSVIKERSFLTLTPERHRAEGAAAGAAAAAATTAATAVAACHERQSIQTGVEIICGPSSADLQRR